MGTKKERSNEIVINAKNVNLKKKDMFEMAEADDSLDAPHDEIKSSIDTTITQTNANSIVENINTELAPEIRTIDTECVNEDPISDAVVNMGKASSLENETKKKRKKRKSMKSDQEQINIEKARENNMDQTSTANTTATE